MSAYKVDYAQTDRRATEYTISRRLMIGYTSVVMYECNIMLLAVVSQSESVAMWPVYMEVAGNMQMSRKSGVDACLQKSERWSTQRVPVVSSLCS